MTINASSQTLHRVSGFVPAVSGAMRSLESIAAEIAPTNIPVLLFGEIGTGKRMFALRIHELSGQPLDRFRTIACASLDSATFAAEVELGAIGAGRPEAEVNGAGTVFFDEISELNAACQRDLLYALPDTDGVPAPGQLTDRVISATTRNLEEDMRAGRFRIELYYRINAVSLRLPPLRERKEDIPSFVEFFSSKHAAQLGKPEPRLSSRTMQMFLDHSWPGNIRELENSVKRIVVLGDDQRAVAGLSLAAETRATHAVETHIHSLKAAAKAASREAERDLILDALGRTHWNRKRAAQELQISYKSLLHKLKQIGLEDSKANQ